MPTIIIKERITALDGMKARGKNQVPISPNSEPIEFEKIDNPYDLKGPWYAKTTTNKDKKQIIGLSITAWENLAKDGKVQILS